MSKPQSLLLKQWYIISLNDQLLNSEHSAHSSELLTRELPYHIEFSMGYQITE